MQWGIYQHGLFLQDINKSGWKLGKPGSIDIWNVEASI
jgi:hypothetical protein